MDNKLGMSWLIFFIIGIVIILSMNDPKANALSHKYVLEIQNPKNIQTQILKVSAYEERTGYDPLFRIPTSVVYVYFEGYHSKYNVPHKLSKAISEGAEFTLKYVAVENEKCILSIESVFNPDFKVSTENIPSSNHSDICKLLN